MEERLSAGTRARGSKPSQRRSRKGAETRSKLVEAAKSVFEADGFFDARVVDIPDRAGLSSGVFYHYFDSKEEIFREVAARVHERLSAPLEDVLDSSSPVTPQKRIREGTRAYLVSYEAQARIIGVIEQVSRYDEQVGAMIADRYQGHIRSYADFIGRLQRAGMTSTELDPMTASGALTAMVTRFAEMWLVQRIVRCSLDQAVDQLSAMVANALGLMSSEAVTAG